MILYTERKGLTSIRLLHGLGLPVRYPTSSPKRGIATSWGCSKVPLWADRMAWVNSPEGIAICANKRAWFHRFGHEGSVIESTEDKEEAQDWAQEVGEKVICRTLLTGHGGRGIVVSRNMRQVVDAPLYTRYFRKTSEYRVIYCHLTGPIYIASKRNSNGRVEDRNALLVRSADNGWTYQTEGPDTVPSQVISVAAQAARWHRYIGLNLMAYDIAFNSTTGEAKVIEANSAPGLNEHSAALVYKALNTYTEEDI